MFLTEKLSVADGYNNQGRQACRLSHRKRADACEIIMLWSECYRDIVQWMVAHFDELPFTYPVVDDAGAPVLDRDGQPKIGKTDANNMYTWLASRVDVSAYSTRLHSAWIAGAFVKAASNLFSTSELMATAERDPGRLTGENVGLPKARLFRQEEINAERARALATLRDEIEDDAAIDAAAEILRQPATPRTVPARLPRSGDFRLFKHENGRLFVSVPTFARGFKPDRESVVQKGVNRLMPLRVGDQRNPRFRLPDSNQQMLLPVRAAPEQEARLADDKNTPKTLELFEKEGRLFVAISFAVPEPEPYVPEAFIGVRIGYFQIAWCVRGHDGTILEEGAFDQSPIKEFVEEMARERGYARDHGRVDRLPRYRARMKRARETVVNDLVAKAVARKAAIGIEDVSGVDKSTRNRKLNLFRSHWDFGQFVTSLTNDAVLAGVPVPTRKRKRQLPSFFSAIGTFSCSRCGESNSGKPKAERRITIVDARMHCGACGADEDPDANAARVFAELTRSFYQSPKKAKKT